VTETAKIVARIIRRKIGKNLRKHVEKMSLNLEEREDAESNITTKFWQNEELCACFID